MPKGDTPQPPKAPSAGTGGASAGPPSEPPADSQALVAERSRLELEKLRAEIARARAETDKAQVETRHLQRPWYQNFSILQPLAVIVVTIAGTLAGFATGFFQSKFDKLAADTEKAQMENDKVMVESANLESRRSFLNRQIAALTKENDGLGKNYQQQLINVNRLQKLYKEASSRAATGEGFKQEAKNLQKELQQMSAQAKKVQDELEATKWHEGDLIAIDVRDQKTGKPIKDVMFTFMGSIDALKNRFEHIKYTRLPARRAGVFIGEAPEPEYYPLSKEDIVAGRATITFTAPGYEEQTAEIEAGTKTFTFYLVPAAPKAPPK